MSELSKREDLIEKYILGGMSKDELRSFESEMKSDPSLKEEVSFQKDLINSIRESRKAEIKANLDNIQIPAPTPSYLTAGISAAALIGSIFLITLNWSPEESPDKPVSDKKEIVAEEETPLIISEDNDISEEKTEEPKEIEQDTETELSSPEEESSMASKEDENAEPSRLTEKPEEKPLFEKPELPEPDDDSGFSKSGIESGSEGIFNTEKRETSRVEVEIKSSEEFNFHYKFFNQKLYLYGDFSKSPYELIELNTDKGRELYMYFDKKYYALDLENYDITKLSPLRDKIIIRGLDNLRD